MLLQVCSLSLFYGCFHSEYYYILVLLFMKDVRYYFKNQHTSTSYYFMNTRYIVKLTDFLIFVDLQSTVRAIMPQFKVMYIASAYYCWRCSQEKGQQIVNLQKVLICISMLRWHYQTKQSVPSINTYCQ